VDGSPDKFGLSINKLNGTPVYSVPPKAVSGGNLVLSGK
jgi:hypothetical protein